MRVGRAPFPGPPVFLIFTAADFLILISKSTIDKVYDAARVEEVIGDFVQLKKSGSNYKGLSPFTDERTPSFMVSPVKQIWKDFSSGKGGNVVAFLMEHEHLTYPEAIRYLARKYQIEIEETQRTDEEAEKAGERESMLLVSEFTREFYEILNEYYAVLPLDVKKFMPYMIADNWLYNYAELQGIARVLQGMNRRTKNRVGMHEAIGDLQFHYREFEGEFNIFFKDLILNSKKKLTELNNQIL